MVFTSFEFLIFFAVIVALYFLLPNRLRWVHLLLASYYFYMAWKPVYALLLLASTFSYYIAALKLDQFKDEGKRKSIFVLGVAFNLGLLFMFKYYNFFESQSNALAAHFGLGFILPDLNVLLPIGISFYTFQGISYLTDVYREDLPAERHFGILSIYMAFFPVLLSGPIERGTHFIPQLRKNFLSPDMKDKVRFEYSRIVSGLRLILLGFFKKLVLADNLALIVNPVYAAPSEYNGVSALVATLAFAFQIFFDFSAYTDIARGTARVLGFDLFENFNRPYFSTSIPDFWRRWHISLSTWFYHYLYMPLSFSKRAWGKRGAAFALLVTFLLCGLWHGANWTFLIWGAIHGLFYLLTYVLTPAARWLVLHTFLSNHPKLCKGMLVVMTFLAVCWAWVVFRADNLSVAMTIWANIVHIPGEMFQFLRAALFDGVPIYHPKIPLKASGLFWLIKPSLKIAWMPIYTLILTAVYFGISYNHHGESSENAFSARNVAYRWGVYFFAFACILLLGRFGTQQFIYFQF
ncbi:MAG: MBOAT family O-acyltransferase [Candidatus Omnitrophota bacterium]